VGAAVKPEDLKVEIAPPQQPSAWLLRMPVGVRVTHLPTGLVAESHKMRSQHMNRHVAMSMIEWGLAEMGYTS